MENWEPIGRSFNTVKQNQRFTTFGYFSSFLLVDQLLSIVFKTDLGRGAITPSAEFVYFCTVFN